MSVSLRAEEQGAFPLTLLQERLVVGEWAARRRGRQPMPFNTIDYRQFVGPVQPALVERALAAVIAHHPAFRTSVRERADISADERLARLTTFEQAGILEPGLCEHTIEPICPLVLRRRRVAGGVDRVMALLRELMLEEGAIPFDYGRPPLIRATLIEPSQSYALLVVAVPHLIVDALSMQLFWHHVETCYEALLQQRPCALPEFGLHYTDLARIEQERLRYGGFDAAAGYWQRRWESLAKYQMDPEEVVPSGATAGEIGWGATSYSAHVGIAASDRVRLAARDLRVTPYIMFLASFCLLLHRSTGRSIVAPWVLFANRGSAGAEHLVAWLANLHMVGIDFKTVRSGRDLVRECRRTITEALMFQALPLAELWRRLGTVAEDRTRGRIFFDWHRVAPNPLCSRRHFERWPIERRTTTSTGVMLKLFDRSDGFSILLIHPAGHGAATARHLASSLAMTVSRLADDPSRDSQAIVDGPPADE